MPKFIDLTGKKFGKLLILSRANNSNNGKVRWNCMCDCGKEKIIIGNSLKTRVTKSCGCLLKENKGPTLKHGHAKKGKVSKTYKIWNSILQRCNNLNNFAYKYYGGRGIKVCKRWFKFENFLKDIGEISDGLTLDRINNNGNYEPNNWRFSTMREQSRNKRNNYLLKYDGNERCLAEWEEITGISQRVIKARIVLGWPIKKALTIPTRKRIKNE